MIGPHSICPDRIKTCLQKAITACSKFKAHAIWGISAMPGEALSRDQDRKFFVN
ncbi:hypothetical protein [Sporolactobacillus terrae]|uniref:hypothetical protein n=1 Tax=Sporolactobacillus terrae TaxID=269673 RepID=UPI00159B9705|nr:hypothetical protein [Sporolactobacillus terrae]